jgi:hypothetical protein
MLGRVTIKKDNYISGRFIAKPLHLPARSPALRDEGRAAPLSVCYSGPQRITKVTLEDSACYP